jgi:predicted glutamine amidotransferase
MCIICYKPNNKKMPKYEVLKTMFDNNPDGSGFMYHHNGRVYGEKGFMTFDDFYHALKKHKNIWKQSPFVLHFRISTQAGVNKECTHPFPLSENMNELKKLRFSDNVGVCHNGIIYLTSSYSAKISHSDTMEFITDYLSLIIKNNEYWKNNDTLTLIERLAESKLAILDGSGHCELIGQFTNVNGIYYSNDSYKKREYFAVSKPRTTTKCYTDYMDDTYMDVDYSTPYSEYDTAISCPAYMYDDYSECDKCPHRDMCWGV